jgi:hypothetical protein
MNARKSVSEPLNSAATNTRAETNETGAHVEGAWLLRRGIKSLLRCDEAETVEGIARYVVSQHRILRFMSAFIERARNSSLPSAFALAGALKSFLEVRPAARPDGTLWIARLGNERRAIETLPPLSPELGWTELKLRNRLDAATLSAFSRIKSLAPTCRRIRRIARRLHRRHEFFKVLRVAQLIGYYTRYLDIFRSGRYRLAVTSNHSNPHGIAFNLAARKCGVPVVLITHGMPVPPVARLSYDLALVHSEAARQTYLEAGCRLDRVFVHGRRQHHAPMPAGTPAAPLTVGIFLCKDVNEEGLRAVVTQLRGDSRVSRILIRAHPKNLWVGLDAWIAAQRDSRLQRSSGGSVFRDIEASDIVLAGNSSVLVEAVTAGRWGGYFGGCDYGSTDLHAFVARGLIYPYDAEVGLDPDAMFCFYRRPDWPVVLRLFANIDEGETTVAARACETMRELSVSHVRARAEICVASASAPAQGKDV